MDRREVDRLFAPEHRKRFEELGPEQVLLHVKTGGFAPTMHSNAIEWLAELEVAEKAREREEREAQAKLNERNLTYARVAAYASIGGLLVAVAGLLVALGSWLLPHHG